MVDLGHQVSELQAENEQLGKENGELKLVLHSNPTAYQNDHDQHRQNPQVHELQDTVQHLLLADCNAPVMTWHIMCQIDVVKYTLQLAWNII